MQTIELSCCNSKSGAPADVHDAGNVDWAPTLNLPEWSPPLKQRVKQLSCTSTSTTTQLLSPVMTSIQPLPPVATSQLSLPVTVIKSLPSVTASQLLSHVTATSTYRQTNFESPKMKDASTQCNIAPVTVNGSTQCKIKQTSRGMACIDHHFKLS